MAALNSTPTLDETAGFLLVKPDILIRGLLDSFLIDLTARGIRIRQFRFARCTSKKLNLAYGGPGFRWEVDDWEINAAAYQFGPTLGLLVEPMDPATQGSAHEILLRSKGRALPKDWDDGTLRRAFGVDRVFNSIHVPDSLTQASNEAFLWFEGALSFRPTQGQIEFVTPEKISSTFSEQGYLSATCNGFIVFCFLQLRLLHILGWNESQIDKNYLVMQIKNHINLMILSAKDGVRKVHTERLSALYLCALTRVNDRAAQSVDREKWVLDVLQKLTVRSSAIAQSLAALWFLCEQLDVYYSPFERYCVEARQRYWDTL